MNSHRLFTISRVLNRPVREYKIFRSVSKLKMSTVPPAAERLDGQTTSIWVEFTALAQSCNAVNIGQGFPDYAPPNYVTNALSRAAGELDGDVTAAAFHQYTRPFGYPPLVKQIARLYSTFGMPIEPMSDVLITVGAYHALYYACVAYLNHGDEAIIIDPAYDSYEAQVRMAGGVPVAVPLRLAEKPSDGKDFTSADLKLDLAELESKFNEKTKMIFVNNPHNPTGKLFTLDELHGIAALAEKYNVLVIADEVYEWLVYKPNKMYRFATLPNMWDRTITVGSAGKTFSVTGWKLGWAIAPAKILQPIKLVHQNCIFTSPTILQEAVSRSFEVESQRLSTPQCYFNTISEELRPKRDKMAAILRQCGMKPIVPEAGYFMLADYSEAKIGDLPKDLGEDSSDPKDYDFVRWLCREKKLATIPTTGFYSKKNKHLGENFIRLCFFKRDDTLDAAAEILRKLTA